MKLFFKFIIFFIFINFTSLFADEFHDVYIVEFGNIDIGKLFLDIDVSNSNYKITIRLINKGLLSGLYKFKGNYEAEGFIKNSRLMPLNYKQFWLTKKKKKIVEIFFDNGSLTNLNLFPKEKEYPRIEYIDVKNYFDPLSSFLNILMGIKQSKTIDGRRIYSMVVDEKSSEDKVETKKILIEDYVNIWADHKRNDLEYIEIKQEYDKKNTLTPLVIKIKFKGLIYKLTKI